MIGSLEQFIGSARWFGGKGRVFTVGDVRRLGWLNQTPDAGPDTPRARIELATIEYDDGGRELYQLPLAYYTDPQSRLEHALVGHWEDDELGPVFVYDALQDKLATKLWLEAFERRHADGELVFHRLAGYDLDLDTLSSLFSGDRSVIKVSRALSIHPYNAAMCSFSASVRAAWISMSGLLPGVILRNTFIRLSSPNASEELLCSPENNVEWVVMSSSCPGRRWNVSRSCACPVSKARSHRIVTSLSCIAS